jgi:hypothetical protein
MEVPDRLRYSSPVDSIDNGRLTRIGLTEEWTMQEAFNNPDVRAPLNLMRDVFIDEAGAKSVLEEPPNGWTHLRLTELRDVYVPEGFDRNFAVRGKRLSVKYAELQANYRFAGKVLLHDTELQRLVLLMSVRSSKAVSMVVFAPENPASFEALLKFFRDIKGDLSN